MQSAQQKLLEKAVETKCNALLGMQTSVTVDRTGDTGKRLVVVTLTGTPCICIPDTQVTPVAAPIAQAIVIDTLNNYSERSPSDE